MYEPKRPPIITSQTLSLPDMRYGIVRCDKFVDIEDPTMDPLHIHGYLEIFFQSFKGRFLPRERYGVSRGEGGNSDQSAKRRARLHLSMLGRLRLRMPLD